MSNLHCKHKIQLKNIKNNDSITYSFLLIVGEIITATSVNCQTKYITIQYNNESITCPVHENEFKSLLELKRGLNIFLFQHCNAEISFNIILQPRQTELRVLPLYIINKGHDGKFQGPNSEHNTIQAACKKISTGAKLIQTFFAEKLHEMGFGRKTFQLENDLNEAAPSCAAFHSELTMENVHLLAQDQIWAQLAREILNSPLSSNERKYLAFISCTKYNGERFDESVMTSHDNIIEITDGYVALGGGGLALFGSACLYTWPNSIGEVMQCFLNESKIDKTLYMDDSCYRGTFGGCFATTLGSVCHELGHTFHLGHTETGIMGRGFDNIHRVFTYVPHKVKLNVPLQPSRRFSDLKALPNVSSVQQSTYLQITKFQKNHEIHQRVRNNDLTTITRNCALIINFNKWFNNFRDENATLQYDRMKREVHSSHGIKMVEIRDSNSEMLVDWWEFSSGGSVYQFKIKDIYCAKGESNILVAMDAIGTFLKEVLS